MDFVTKTFEDGETKVYPMCTVHNWFYAGHPPLTLGCQQCWNVYWFMLYARTPKGLQLETLDQLEELVTHAGEAADKGYWDVGMKIHPIVEIEKDAIKDDS